ncbi:hypothetical protein H5410_022205 [Solanum commersonii]|uniref:Uncharacterized protein n=1 Tax=Solanum commersonii TaxID=4109 RepID=A0A9J5ZHD6_SOLCO|nr:hypothetical protein H5410_022205 [Solanum commersonii]
MVDWASNGESRKKFVLNRLASEGPPNFSDDPIDVSLPEILNPIENLEQLFIATFTAGMPLFLSYCEIPADLLPVTIARHNVENCWSSSPNKRSSKPYPDFPNLVIIYPPFPEVIAFGQDLSKSAIGCHHPKLLVLLRRGSLCVVVTSANLVVEQAPTCFLGKASTVGLEKAVEVLDTLGNSMRNLNSRGFMTGMASRQDKISILAFEIANTITKAANLLQSLSEENVAYLNKELLPSKGVQQLVSTNMKDLLTIVAHDKREDFAVFCCEVIRFGDMCKDPQWHNLGRYFSKLDMDTVTHKQLRTEAEMTMQELITLAQHTSELYHELHALDKFEKDYQRKIEALIFLKLSLEGEHVMMLESELKHQRKSVRNLKKKSLWFKSLEEVVEKLVDIAIFIHQEISEAYGYDGLTSSPRRKSETLGEAGLALRYANLITRIDAIALYPTSPSDNMRDALYNGLPPNVKTSLRSRLQAVTKEELTLSQIKADLGITLQWLVPIATNTKRNDLGKMSRGHKKIIRLQTLYHADKEKMDELIIELVTWLHHMISLRRSNKAFPPKTSKVQFSEEDRNLLEKVMQRGMLVPGISKSQDFVMSKKHAQRLSKSTGTSPHTQVKA